MTRSSVLAFLGAWALFCGACALVLVSAGLLPNALTAALACGLGFLAGAVILTLAFLSSVAAKAEQLETALQGLESDSVAQAQGVSSALNTLSTRISDIEEKQQLPVAAVAAEPDARAVQAPAKPSLPEQIASAILSNRVDLYVQPVHALPSRRPVFFECLSRLRSEEGDILYPSGFLEHANRSRLITTLDNFLMLRCVQIIRQFGKRASLETFFVNLSATSLRDPDFFDQFVDFLSDHDGLSSHLVLEFSAPELPDLLPAIGPGLARLKRAGYAFSVDKADLSDVGAQTADIGVRYVKIPAQTLLETMGGTGLLEDAKANGQTCIATFVEDEKTLIDVIECGFDHAQGYVFGRPRPWDDVLVSKGLADAA